jgi:hypothetical protein
MVASNFSRSNLQVLSIRLFFTRCVNYGVLPHSDAERLYKIVVERKRTARLGINSPSPPKKKKKKAKILKEESCDDPDVIVSRGGDGVGTTTL